MHPDNNPESQPPNTLHDDIAAAISGMIYISESEGPLELMAWPEVTDLQTLQYKIAEQMQFPASDQTIITVEDFLGSIHQTADPADPVMLAYAKQYDALFELLQGCSKEVTVIRAGKIQVHLFIAALGGEAPIIIHTTAVET